MSNNHKHFVRFILISITAFLSISAYLVTLDASKADKPLYTGNEEHQITTEAALNYVANYHSMEGEQLTAGFMGRNIFEQILAQEEAVGIRIYNGRRDDASPTFVIIGVDAEGNDLIGGVIGQKPIACPPICANGGLTLNPHAQPIAMK